VFAAAFASCETVQLSPLLDSRRMFKRLLAGHTPLAWLVLSLHSPAASIITLLWVHAQIAAELGAQPEVVRIIVSGTEFRNDAAQLRDHSVQPPFQLQVRGLHLGCFLLEPVVFLCCVHNSVHQVNTGPLQLEKRCVCDVLTSDWSA
jgi:hypothetical protein